MAKETLIPVRHEEVAVCGEYILAAVTEDGKAYFSPRHVCDALGIDWKTQYRKVQPTSLRRAGRNAGGRTSGSVAH